MEINPKYVAVAVVTVCTVGAFHFLLPRSGKTMAAEMQGKYFSPIRKALGMKDFPLEPPLPEASSDISHTQRLEKRDANLMGSLGRQP